MESINFFFSNNRNKTYVDFFPFYNPNTGSELNVLKIIISFGRYELLTHPVCELFLHLKWLKARWLQGVVILIYLYFTLVALAHTVLRYGQIGNYFPNYHCQHSETNISAPILVFAPIDQETYTLDHGYKSMDRRRGGLPCVARYLEIPLIIGAVLVGLIGKF